METNLSRTASRTAEVLKLINKEYPIKSSDIINKKHIPRSSALKIIASLCAAKLVKRIGNTYVPRDYYEIESAIKNKLKIFIKCSEVNPYNIHENSIKDFASNLEVRNDDMFKTAFRKVCNKLGITIWNSE